MKKGGFLARSTLPRPGGQREAGQKRVRPEIEKAIGELRARIALLEKEFPDEPTSMAYRDALALAVLALEKERDRG